MLQMYLLEAKACVVYVLCLTFWIRQMCVLMFIRDMLTGNMHGTCDSMISYRDSPVLSYIYTCCS